MSTWRKEKNIFVQVIVQQMVVNQHSWRWIYQPRQLYMHPWVVFFSLAVQLFDSRRHLQDTSNVTFKTYTPCVCLHHCICKVIISFHSLVSRNCIAMGPVGRRPDSAVHLVVVFSTMKNCLKRYKTTDIDLKINKNKYSFINTKVQSGLYQSTNNCSLSGFHSTSSWCYKSTKTNYKLDSRHVYQF